MPEPAAEFGPTVPAPRPAPSPHDQTTPARVAHPPTDHGEPPVPGYEILGELGRGGMGVVYRARQTGLNRVVALKMVLGGDHAGPGEVARFLAEAEVVAAVRHPHVVQVFEFGEAGGRPFFAMEYLDGGTLAGAIRAAGRLAPRAAAAVVEKLARGVQAAHDLGIVHRDLKPGNVLLDAAGEPKVVDFGLAKRGGRGDLTRTGAVMGTPAYMAPEQAAGRAKFAGPAADVYALGVILYECLTGRVPFRDDDDVRLLARVAEDEPPPVRDLAPDVPGDLEAVCLRCLRKDPHARYDTAGALAADLRRFLDGEPVLAPSSGLLSRVAGLLGRSLKDTEFAAYSTAMFWFAAVVLTFDVVIQAAVLGLVEAWVISVCQLAKVAGFVAVLGRFRGGRFLPATAAERQLWSVGGGYIACCAAAAVSLRLAALGFEPLAEASLYPAYAMLTALMFFAFGSILWGGCYALGVAFLAAGFVMAAAPRFAPLVCGTTWAAALVVVGLRLRRLAVTCAA